MLPSITAFRRDRGLGEGHQDFLPDEGSTAFSGAEHGHGTLQGLRRGGGLVGGLQGSVPGQSPTARVDGGDLHRSSGEGVQGRFPGQVIDVPKLALPDGVPHRAALREPQVAEQLVCRRGWKWHVAGTRSGHSLVPARVAARWDPLVDVGYATTQWSLAEGLTASPGRYTNTGQG